MAIRHYRLKIAETRNYHLEEIRHNDLISKDYQKVCRTLSYLEYFLLFNSTFKGYVSISVFSLLVGFPVGIKSVVFLQVLKVRIRIKICAINALINNYNSIIRKKKEQYDKIVFLAKTKLKTITVLISKAFALIMTNLFQWIMCEEKIITWKKEIKIIENHYKYGW